MKIKKEPVKPQYTYIIELSEEEARELVKTLGKTSGSYDLFEALDMKLR